MRILTVSLVFCAPPSNNTQTVQSLLLELICCAPDRRVSPWLHSLHDTVSDNVSYVQHVQTHRCTTAQMRNHTSTIAQTDNYRDTGDTETQRHRDTEAHRGTQTHRHTDTDTQPKQRTKPTTKQPKTTDNQADKQPNIQLSNQTVNRATKEARKEASKTNTQLNKHSQQ